MIRATTQDAYRLMHEGAVAFAEMEANGIRVDTPYLDAQIARVADRIKELDDRLKTDEVWTLWRRRYGRDANLDSDKQLGAILFTDMGLPCESRTATGQPSTTSDVLEWLEVPFVEHYLYVKRLKKLHSTYLIGLRRELVDGWLHPFFNLHSTITFRSSSDSINFQNIPIRWPLAAKLIRRAFIPRPGCRLVECDFSGQEVRVGACYHKDPTSIADINDKTRDPHRDSAASCFLLPKEEVAKPVRQTAKGAFTFAEQYGDYYPKVARNLWRQIRKQKLKTVSGVPLYDHLQSVGIRELGACDPDRKPAAGTFEKHIKAVEDEFWGQRYAVYNEWKRRWYKAYERTGGFDMLTGFRVDGVYTKNEVINSPVQGSASHCTLKVIIELRRRIRKAKMAALIIGQIHDSIVGDVPDSEVADYVGMVHDLATVWLPQQWQWIIVPLEVEAEACPLEGSWYDKEPV